MLKNINSVAFFSIVFYPLLLVALSCYYTYQYGISSFEIILFLIGFYVSTISVGIGLHRLWSHDTYKTNKYVEFILIMFSAGTLQGPALSWASNHFKHHTYTDTEKDPHTPLKFKNPWKGFFWAHMGWMLSGSGSYKSIDKVTMVKLGRNKLLRWQLKYYWHLAIFMNLVLPMIIGYVFGGNLISAYAAFLSIGLGRALQQQTTFFVNSLCHFVGTKKYVNATAGDIWWLFFLLLGENWHNFHHAFPSDYRNGSKWYHVDVHKWIIYLMSKCGLAWDLKITPEVRVNAKLAKTASAVSQMNKKKLESMQEKVVQLLDIYQQKFNEFNDSSDLIKGNLYKSFDQVHKNLININGQLSDQIKHFEDTSEKLVKGISKKIHNLDIALKKLYIS